MCACDGAEQTCCKAAVNPTTGNYGTVGSCSAPSCPVETHCLEKQAIDDDGNVLLVWGQCG